MKILKIIGLVVAVMVVAILIIGLTAAKTYDVKREAIINTPVETVFANVSLHQNFIKWSPWQKLDTTVKTTFEGTDGTVGAKYSWSGNDKVGEGSMTITAIEPNKTLEQDLEFLRPFKSSAHVYTTTEAVEGGTKVVWGMKGESNFMSRVFMTFMGGMDKAIGGDYERGLANLKTLSESGPAATVYIATETDWAEKNALSIRKTVAFADFAKFYGDNYPKMAEAIGKAGSKPGIPLGVYYSYDEKGMTADVAAAIPYEGKEVKAAGYPNLNLPARKGYLIDYFGDYQKMGLAYGAMTAKLKELGQENPDMVIEEYVNDPMTETDTAKWHTKIYFFVK